MSESSTKPAALPPVPLDQVLVLVNRYLKSTATFLNDFAAQSDARLRQVSQKTAELEVELQLLEAKIAGMGELQAENQLSSEPSVEGRTASKSIRQTAKAMEASERRGDAGGKAAITNKQEDVAASPPSALVSEQDGPLSKYRAMLKVGIPRGAVINKMHVDGVGDLLDKL